MQMQISMQRDCLSLSLSLLHQRDFSLSLASASVVAARTGCDVIGSDDRSLRESEKSLIGKTSQRGEGVGKRIYMCVYSVRVWRQRELVVGKSSVERSVKRL